MAFYRVLEALGEQGCPICVLRGEAVHRYLDSLLYESVNDVGLRQTLLRSRGFCRAHAWELVPFGDSLGTAIVYKDQVDVAIRDVQEAARSVGAWRRGFWRGDGARDGTPAAVLRRRRTPEVPCPACQVGEEAQARYLAALLEHLDDPAIRTAIQHSMFLCLPHLADALEAARTPAQALDLLEIAQDRLAHLRGELAELIRKRDYRFAHEPQGEEQTSWFRAIGQLVGWRRSDRRARPDAD